MIRTLAAALSVFVVTTTVGAAEERQRLGYGRLSTNDVFGDGEDRWQTGSYASSRAWGPGWAGQLPTAPGRLLELRFNARVTAPDNVVTPAPGDRPFAGASSLGLHTHHRWGETQVSLGGDMVATGKQTGLDDIHAAIHGLVGADEPSAAVRNTQIGSEFHPTLVLEMGRDLDLGGNARLRPFVEVRAGLETLVRAGADMTIGDVGGESFWCARR